MDNSAPLHIHIIYFTHLPSVALLVKEWVVLTASANLFQVAEGSKRSHFLNITLHLSSQLLGWSTLIMSSCDDVKPRTTPNSLHLEAQFGTILLLTSRSLGMLFPTKNACMYFMYTSYNKLTRNLDI